MTARPKITIVTGACVSLLWASAAAIAVNPTVPTQIVDLANKVDGVHPRFRACYGSFFSFNDPDGNTWLAQEVTTRRSISEGLVKLPECPTIPQKRPTQKDPQEEVFQTILPKER